MNKNHVQSVLKYLRQRRKEQEEEQHEYDEYDTPPSSDYEEEDNKKCNACFEIGGDSSFLELLNFNQDEFQTLFRTFQAEFTSYVKDGKGENERISCGFAAHVVGNNKRRV